MVKESKVKMECKVVEVKSLGNEGGAGNLVICEVIRMHIDDSLLDENKKLDQRKINHVARLGGDWYCVVNEHNLFQVENPIHNWVSVLICCRQPSVAVRSYPEIILAS